MAGVTIEVVIERGGDSFSLSSHQSLVNSVSAIDFSMLMAGTSEFSITLNPTFEAASELIQSGMLGWGMKGTASPNIQKTAVRGVYQNIGSSTQAQALAGDKTTPINEAVMIRVRFGYGEDSVLARTPWFYGAMKGPSIDFGEEISITLNAMSSSYFWMLDDTPTIYSAMPISTIIRRICDKNGITPVFEGSSQAVADSYKITTHQSTNSFTFLFALLVKAGLTGYFVGSTDDNPREQFRILSKADVRSAKPKFALVMYKQIDVNNGIYPINAVNADIANAFVGYPSGGRATVVSPENKEIKVKTFDEKSKKDPALGGSVGFSVPEGRASSAGVQGGIKRDASSTSARFYPAYRDENPGDVDGAEQTVVRDEERAFQMTLDCPMLPFVLPGQLVNVEIGDIGNISGIFEVKKVTHSIAEGGAETSIEVYRDFGYKDTAKAGLSQNKQTSEGGKKPGATAKKMTVVKGVATKKA